MTPEQGLAAQEVLFRQALYEVFGDKPEMIEKIESAFPKSDATWESHLTATFGKEATRRFFSAFRRDLSAGS